jgi:predicted transcriptional regulator
MNTTQKQVKIILAIAETIRELKRIPSGHLYANLMRANIDLSTYESIIGILKNSGIVKEENFELIWVGKE